MLTSKFALSIIQYSVYRLDNCTMPTDAWQTDADHAVDTTD